MCVSARKRLDSRMDTQSKDGLRSRAYLKDDALALARQIGVISHFDLLVIDAEEKFIRE